MTEQKKILIVDDSAFYRQSISEILKKDSRFRVIGAVSNGSEAIRFLSQNTPDLITLDLEMPTMDGFTFLRWLMAHEPLPVVVISSRSENQNIIKALELGAVDFIVKPTHSASLKFMDKKEEIISKLTVVSDISGKKIALKREEKIREMERAAPYDTPEISMGKGDFDLVVIGASTGGPPAIQSILTRFPKNFPVPIVVTQHMPQGFTHYFAERLNKSSQITVKEAEAGEKVLPGHALIAPGGHHLLISGSAISPVIELRKREPSDKYSPSVDEMVQTAVRVFGGRILGVILTGMGSDGKRGMKDLKDKGGMVLAESEDSCIVYGMPKEVVESGLADKVLSLTEISEEILRRCSPNSL